MQQLIFATHNQHKLAELKALLLDQYTVLSLSEAGIMEEIPETGTTLKQNASIKSNAVYKKLKINCFADDTGLEVDALNGAPGVYSARYAGKNPTYEENVVKLLQELSGHSKRTARFKTVISLIMNGKEYFFEGKVEGSILDQPRGLGGFGYDPVFMPEGYNQTFSEMNLKTKNEISHRGKAVKKLVAFLKKQ